MENNDTHRELAHGPPAEALSPPELDFEAMRADLAEYQLTPEQEEEYFAALWTIVKTLVDTSCGLDAAQWVMADFNERTRQRFCNDLDTIEEPNANSREGGDHA